MQTYKIADLVFKFQTQYEYTKNLCKEYLFDSATIDCEFSINQSDIDYERQFVEVNNPAYLESLAVFRKIIEYVLKNANGFFLHSSAVAVNNEGYVFIARSGVGKSTHANNWAKYLKNKLVYVNDDKPLIRKINGEFYVYGTPWCGKHNLGNNVKVKIKSCAFIVRAKDNKVEPVDAKYFLTYIFEQVIRPSNLPDFSNLIDLFNEFYSKVNFYKIECNKSIDSAKLAFSIMSGETE